MSAAECVVVLPRRKEVRWFVRGAEDYEPMPPSAAAAATAPPC